MAAHKIDQADIESTKLHDVVRSPVNGRRDPKGTSGHTFSLESKRSVPLLPDGASVFPRFGSVTNPDPQHPMRRYHSIRLNSGSLVFSLWVLTVAGCAAPEVGPQTSAQASSWSAPVSLDDPGAVTAALGAQHADWNGIRYKVGGVGRDGVDCSGFTLVTYVNRFGVSLPRTVEQQARLGVTVSQHALHAGDLVFFKTGFKTRHVGIYVGDRKFLHASTSQGVTLSSLDNPYWRGKFWQARRLSL